MKLRYTLPAISDFNGIFDYLEERSPQGAARVEARIKSVLERLLPHPYLGAQTSDPTIRRINISPYPYLVFYEGRSTAKRRRRRP
jgi:toxin ParE1/3/4